MSLIGAPLPRPDARGKVTGAARYPGDLAQPGMLHLKVVFARRPHARVLAIEADQALAVPGVVAVLTGADVPYNRHGLIDADQPVLCDQLVRYYGDKVAVVAAESSEAAVIAAKLVHVRYEDLPPVTDPRDALRPDSPLVHADLGTNTLLHTRIKKGEAASAMQTADLVLEHQFTTSWQEHAYLQPEAGIAYLDERDRVVIETAGQWLHEDRRQIAAMLQLPEEQIVVRYAAIGGAFGGREDLSIQHLLALATWKLRRPVKIIWNREESMIGHHKRHPFRIRCQWGVMRDGRIVAAVNELIADGGAYASTSAEVVKIAALLCTGCYDISHISTDGFAVYTNNIPSGAFRGFGAPQAQFAAEVMIARLAQAIEMDPIELRRINMYREGSIEPTQQPLPEGVSALPVLERCLQEARARFAFGTPRKHAAPHLRRGVAIASGMKNIGYSFGFPEQATATVELIGVSKLERAIVRVGAADVGQGAHLILRQIAAEMLRISIVQIELVAEDSAEAPNAGSASASRLTLMAGRAVKDAAAAALAAWEGPQRATVQYRPPATTPIDPITFSGRPNYAYGYVSQAVEVEVNTLTGQVQILRIISVHDVGKAINRQQVEAQIEGCLAQAVGYTLTEHFQMRDGMVLTPHFSTYLLPTSMDMPAEIYPVILELADPNGPFGARGMAEMPLIPLAPAVAAAIHDAVGVWVHEQPFTPERVLAALKERAAGSERAR